MKKTAEEYVSLVSLLERGVSFAAYSLPGRDGLDFIVDDNVSPIVSSRQFIVNTWHGDKLYICDRKDTGTRYDMPPMKSNGITGVFQRKDTPWGDYEMAVVRVTELLRQTSGKVVISRQKILSDRRIDYSLIAECIRCMFKTYKNAFRAIYYTPTTGAWCVCSPELLLSVDKKSGEFHTVALAGTRPKEISGDWDKKNIREHFLVVRYIDNTLRSIGLLPSIGAMETMVTGSLQHILTRITGNIKDCERFVNAMEIMDVLHPTPAICGYPVGWAKGIIAEVETHDRECYGGYIAIDDDSMLLAHVNLRSFAFSPGMCCFWGGGGIMPESSPASEWAEASLKIDTTLSFIKKRLSLDT